MSYNDRLTGICEKVWLVYVEWMESFFSYTAHRILSFLNELRSNSSVYSSVIKCGIDVRLLRWQYENIHSRNLQKLGFTRWEYRNNYLLDGTWWMPESLNAGRWLRRVVRTCYTFDCLLVRLPVVSLLTVNLSLHMHTTVISKIH